MTRAAAGANPFPGLRPFREDEESLFFGRESQVDAMVDKLAATRFLAVLGTSGSGKSSLVNCGLRPALHRGSMGHAGTAWRIAQFRPGGDPMRALGAALSAEGVLFDDAGAPTRRTVVEATLQLSRLGLVDIVDQARLAQGTNLLVVVDQFEELFRFRQVDASGARPDDADPAIAFVNLLLAAREQGGHAIHVVLTMRSDFLGDCTRFPGLAEAINEGQYLVPRMTRHQRRAAIAGPIDIGGATIDPALLTRLVNDLGDDPDQLSILQHALNRTWVAWRDDGGGQGPIERRHYEAIGTMAHALDRHAEAAYAELADPRAREVCERIFKALTDRANDARGIRRPTRLSMLCVLSDAAPAEAIAVIDVFREPSRSFLMPPAAEHLGADTIVDITHESLMRVWRRLGAWVDDEALSAQHARRIADAAALHLAGKSSLWRDPELQLALDWRARQRPTKDWAVRYGVPFEQAEDFVNASAAGREAERDAVHRRRTQVRLAIGSVITALIVVGVMFFVLWQQAQRARYEVLAAKTVGQSRVLIDSDDFNGMDKALLVTAAGHRLLPSRETYGGLQYALDRTTSLIKVLSLPEPAIAFTPDRAGVLTVHDHGMRLWSVEDGSPLTPPMEGHADKVSSAAFSPDGRTLVSASEDGTLRLWDARSGASSGAPLRGHEGRVWSVAFGPDGRTIASGGEDRTVRIWDAITRAPGRVFPGHTNRVWALAFSPDGATLASGGDDTTLRVWDIATGALRGAPRAGAGVVSTIAFDPTGSLLASGGGDSAVRLATIQDATLGEPMAGHADRVWSVAFSPDGRTLASGSEDHRVRLWNVADRTAAGPALQGQKERVWRVAFSADGRSVLSASADRTVARWDASAASAPGSPSRGHEGPVRSIAASPDGRSLASAGDDGSIRLWDVGTRLQRGAALRGHEGSVAAVAFSPDGRLLASAGEDGTVRLWDVATGTSRATLKGHDGRVWSVAFSPDGKTLASGGQDASVRLWDAGTGEARGAPLTGHRSRVWSVVFSPDGSTVASSGEDATVVLWDLSTRQPRVPPLQGHRGRVWSVAFSPGGKTLASGGDDGTIRLWDSATGKAIGHPRIGHLPAVTSVAFSPDGRTLASGGDDATVRFWDAVTMEPRGAPLHGHEQSVAALAFGPDSRLLVSASDDRTIRWWDAPDRWIDRVCAKVVRNLSPAEWRQLVGDVAYVAQCPGLPVPTD